jgi:cytochrome P450
VVAGFIEIPFDEVDAKEQEQADLTDVEIIRHIAGVLLAEHDTTRNQRAPAVRESAQPDPEPGLAA